MRGTRWVILSILAAASFGGCAREAPGWSRRPAVGVRGDDTIEGEPARLPRLSLPPIIDGKLDEAAWQGAAVLGPFVDTGDGRAAPKDYPVDGFARVAWDERNLYLGFVIYDGKPVAGFGRNETDPHVWGRSSGVEIMIQPGDPGDNREYFEMQFDTAGATFDSRWDDYNLPISGEGPARVFGHQDWSCAARTSALVAAGKGGFYSIEVALPWSSITSSRVAVPPRAGDVWRLNLYSFRDGQRYALGWSSIRRQGNFHRSGRWGRVAF